MIMCLGSGRVQFASRNVAGQCALSATGVVLLVKLTPIPVSDKKGKSPKGPLGRAPPKGPSSVPPTTSSRPHVVPPRGGGPPGAGVGDPPPPSPPAVAQPSEEMVKALLLLQNVMSKEDFSKYEKLVLPPPKKEEKKTLREEELWRRCQKEESLKKQVQMHLEQIKKHEHNLEQQKIMLTDVQLQLKSVKALRALVAETREPEGPSLHAPLPAPREPPPGDDDPNTPGSDLDMEATPLDSDDDDMVDRDAGSWLTVASNRKKRGKAPVVMKLKGSRASVRKGSLRQSFVDKTCIFEDEMSGVEVGKALLKLSQHGFRDLLSSLPPEAFQQFMNFQPDIPLLHEIKSSSSSSGSAEGNGPVEFVGNASSFSSGIQAKRVSFNDPCAEISVPQSAKPGLFSGEPASFFTGVVAGTVLRRWNGIGGRRRWGPGVQSSSVAASLQKVSAPVQPGETDSGGFLLVSSAGASGAEKFPIAETKSGGAQFVFPGAEKESGGALEFCAAENDLGGAQFLWCCYWAFWTRCSSCGQFWS